MEYKEHIQKAIDYIEQNLVYDINLSDLAKVSGYSQYHFTRIFKEATKLTPADYIRKRRITEITKQMSECSDCISDIAFSFGFNSKENFVRAFKAEHHVLPTEYKTAKSSLKMYEKISYEVEPISITPEIAELNAFLLTVYPCDEPYVQNFGTNTTVKSYLESLLVEKNARIMESQSQGENIALLKEAYSYESEAVELMEGLIFP